MSGGVGSTSEKKQAYFSKLIQLLDEYPRVIIVGADNVGSNHMQTIRKNLRGKGIMLMGKNTMIRKAIKGHIENNPNLEKLLPHIKGNIGFVFTKDELADVGKIIEENKIQASARSGAIAPCDVIVPAGPTGLEPTKTSFFIALNIPTKINKGQVDIVSDVHLITEGDKVEPSHASLLTLLNIKPFKYGLGIKVLYDNGTIIDPEVLKITNDDIIESFKAGVKNISSLSLGAHYPTKASLPHLVINGYKKILSVSLATEYTFEKAEKLKEYLANPTAFAATTAAPAQQTQQESAAKEEAKEEPKEESDEDMGFGLFD